MWAIGRFRSPNCHRAQKKWHPNTQTQSHSNDRNEAGLTFKLEYVVPTVRCVLNNCKI